MLDGVVVNNVCVCDGDDNDGACERACYGVCDECATTISHIRHTEGLAAALLAVLHRFTSELSQEADHARVCVNWGDGGKVGASLAV